MKKDVVRYSLGLPTKIYEEIKEIAEEKGLPMSRVISVILNAYLKSRKERMGK